MCELRRRESRGHNGLTAVMPAAGKPHRKEAQWRPVSVGAVTIFATDRFVGSVELSLLSTVTVRYPTNGPRSGIGSIDHIVPLIILA